MARIFKILSKDMAIKQIGIALLLCLVILSLSQDVFARPQFFKNFNGSLGNRYRLRTTGAESDHDLQTLFNLNIGDPAYHTASGAIQAGATFDLDGGQSGPFRTVYDTFDSRAVGRIYYAYLNVRDTWPFELLRVGRQHSYDFENFYFDGISFDSQPFYGFKISAYSGIPVHLFENQFGWGETDFLVGEAVTWTPIQKIRLRFDHAFLRDRASAFRQNQGYQEDHLFGSTAWVTFNKYVDAYAKFTSFYDQVRDLTFATSLRLPKQDLRLNLRAFRLLEGYNIRVPDLEAYSIVGTYLPYTELGASITKGFGKHFMADAGFVWRMLDDNQTTSPFNHGYKRAYLSLTTMDLPVKDLVLTATGDYYHGEDSLLRNDYFGGSFSATQHLLKKRLSVGAGTAYYLYRYNFATGNESNDVQTYFLNVDGKITKRLRVRSSYEFENNDYNGYHTFNLAIIEDF